MKLTSLPSLPKIFTFTLLTLGYGYFAFASSLLVHQDYTIQLASLILSLAAVMIYLVLRRSQGLPRTGMELGVVAYLVAVVGTLLVSPDVRVGMEQAALLVRLGIFFYLALDVFASGLPLRAVLGPVMLVSGLISALAAGEALIWYQGWFASTGGQAGLPDVAYRVITLVGHSNSYMGYMNFLFPLVLVYFITRRTPAAFFSMALWVTFFVLTIPFTSSRAGLLGLAAGVAVLIFLWAVQHKLWLIFQKLSHRRKMLAVGLGGAGLLVSGGAVLYILAWFARHPTHGSLNLFSGREALWATAVQIWQKSPWVGIGFNRYAFEYVIASMGYPPGFWAGHAHSFPLQVLAESGLAGFITLFLAAGLFLRLAWKAYRRLPASEKLWGAAILAGLVSGLVYSIPENTWANQYLVTSAILFAAWLIAKGGLTRFERLKLPVLGLPLLLAGCVTIFGLWGYQPYQAGLAEAESGSTDSGLALMREAESRDPTFALYPQQIGLVQAEAWGKTGSPAALLEARTTLQEFLAREPSLSLWWADLAILDFAAGKPDAAMQGMAKAAGMAPGEATYPLNLGWFQEQSSLNSQAVENYNKVLALQPEWACHPFWQATALRKALVQQIDCTDPIQILASMPHLKKAEQLLAGGDLAAANLELQAGQAAGEARQIYLVLAAQVAQAAGKPEQATESRQELARLVAQPTLRDWYEASAMSIAVYQREVLNREIVPGYLKLAPYAGQDKELMLLAQELTLAGKVEEAGRIEAVSASLAAGGEGIEP